MSEQDSKKKILKATGVLGSAQLLIIFIGMIRVKVLAILLGPVGVGIAGLFQATIDLLKAATGFGIGFSAVRDIAAASASQDENKIASTILVMRRWTWATGLSGMLLMIIFCKQLSQIAFGNETYATSIAILSATLLLTAVSSGQLALLQGLRMIGSMAKANVLGALIGLIGAVCIYYFWGVEGIVPAILLTYILALLISWLYSRKVKINSVQLSTAETFQKGKSMAALGFFMVITGLASTATMYLVRSFVVQQGGMASVGHFVAAWSISSMYISAVFGAMSADYFPRLSGVQDDPVAINKMVNEQTEIAVLLAAPIIICMISFVQLVIRIFYSADFLPTMSILDWQLMGDFFKVLAWPIGFILLAKGKGKHYIFTEIAWNVLYCTAVYIGWKYFKIEITGIAFLLAYIVYIFLLFVVTRQVLFLNGRLMCGGISFLFLRY